MLFFRMSYLLSTSFCIFSERSLQILIPQSFLFLCKMYLPLLLWIILVIQDFIAELLACEIKSAVTYHIVTMIVSTRSLYTVHLSAKYILCQKSRNTAPASCYPLSICPSSSAHRCLHTRYDSAHRIDLLGYLSPDIHL